MLTPAGTVSHELASVRAEADTEKFRRTEDAKPSPVEKHFVEVIEQVKQFEKAKRPKKRRA